MFVIFLLLSTLKRCRFWMHLCLAVFGYVTSLFVILFFFSLLILRVFFYIWFFTNHTLYGKMLNSKMVNYMIEKTPRNWHWFLIFIECCSPAIAVIYLYHPSYSFSCSFMTSTNTSQKIPLIYLCVVTVCVCVSFTKLNFSFFKLIFGVLCYGHTGSGIFSFPT